MGNRHLVKIFCCLFFLLFSQSYALELPLKITEYAGIARENEPVSFGVPIPRGEVSDLSSLSMLGSDGKAVTSQFETLATWPDGSTRWLLIDFPATANGNQVARYKLNTAGKGSPAGAKLEISQEGNAITVNTGVMKTILNTQYFDLFNTVYLDNDADGAFSDDELVTSLENVPGIYLRDSQGRELASRWGLVDTALVEAEGPVRATVMVKGGLYEKDQYKQGERLVDYTIRMHFYAGSGLVRIFFTLENHNPTLPLKDEDGDRSNWVMGRKGSLFFDEMALQTKLRFNGPIEMSVGDKTDDVLDRVVLVGEGGGVYQESSGGDNWFIRTHMNHVYKIPLTFRGAHFNLDGVSAYQRNRPDAWLQAVDRKFGLAVAIRHFWQNFPKALTADPEGVVRVALWPEEFPDSHELQGGEIKTHELTFFFHTGNQGSTPAVDMMAERMSAFHYPLIGRAPADWYIKSGEFDDVAEYNPGRFPIYEKYNHDAVEGDINLFTDREAIDEYGWRNFGDTWAKNEKNQTEGPHDGRLMISHFNHEYDHAYGMLLQSLRTLDKNPEISLKWWQLAETGNRHQSDIDYYHTLKDPFRDGIHNGGKFTHSAHGAENALAGHRGSPRLTWFGALRWPWGQSMNPESGHQDCRGLYSQYYLTGDRRLLETALNNSNLILYKVEQDKFAQNVLSRNSGNNLQALTDAYLLTWDERYMKAAEKVLEDTHPDKMWFTSAEGRKANPDKSVDGWWSQNISVVSAARFTEAVELKTVERYDYGRNYVISYADFAATYLAAGPENGFHTSWSESKGGRGHGFGPWTYRLTDGVMYGAKFTDDSNLRARCLKAAGDAFEYMKRRADGKKNLYGTSKDNTMITGGGHEYTHFKVYGNWASWGDK